MAHSPRELAEAPTSSSPASSDPAAVERLVFAEDGVLPAARPGFRYLECSTISPDLMRRVAEALRAPRARTALEAPVTGSKLGAEKGTLLLMTGRPPRGSTRS